jgi:hypothetical protein
VRRLSGLLGDGTGSWIVTKPLNDLAPLPQDETGVEQWVSQNNAIDAQTLGDGSAITNLEVTIQGPSSTQITLTGIDFVVVRRRTGIIQGGLVQNSGAGPTMFRYIDVDLDGKPPKMIDSFPNYFARTSIDGKAIKFPYLVSEISSEVFDIIAHTHGDVTWYAELLWSVNGRNGESIINNSGKYFETAVAPRATVQYAFHGGSWQACAKGDISCG